MIATNWRVFVFGVRIVEPLWRKPPYRSILTFPPVTVDPPPPRPVNTTFTFSGVLPDSSPDALLEDLISADRYRLMGMKRICQSMLRLRADNCLQVWIMVCSQTSVSQGSSGRLIVPNRGLAAGGESRIQVKTRPRVRNTRIVPALYDHFLRLLA